MSLDLDLLTNKKLITLFQLIYLLHNSSKHVFEEVWIFYYVQTYEVLHLLKTAGIFPTNRIFETLLQVTLMTNFYSISKNYHKQLTMIFTFKKPFTNSTIIVTLEKGYWNQAVSTVFRHQIECCETICFKILSETTWMNKF